MAPIKHGLSRTKNYQRWHNIMQRCYNKQHPHYAFYGGRGITMCDEWKNDFKAFYDYVTTLPHYGEEGMSIDRERNNEGYKPGNIRWVDKHLQRMNQRLGTFAKSGFRGIVCKNGVYSVKICVRGNVAYLGSYNSLSDAIDVRDQYILDNDLWEYTRKPVKKHSR